MIPDPVLFGFTLLDSGALLFLLVYILITLSDLECDYLNAQQCCATLNFWVIPKLLMHLFLSVALLVTWHIWLFLINLPVAIWLCYELYRLPIGNMGIYDPTEIHNRGMVKKHLRDCIFYLGYYLITFFLYLYWMINALLEGDPIRRHEEGQIVTEF